MRRALPKGAARREPAQIIVLFGLGLFALVALAALVLDGGNIYVQRRTTQLAADAGAIAGVRELRAATATTPVSVIAAAVNKYVQSNAFGTAPTVQCAYFVATDGVSAVGTIVHGSGLNCPAGPVSAIPAAASGVHVDTRIAFSTYLLGIFNIGALNADGHATGQTGVLTAADTRNAPLIVCGGGGSTGFDALALATQTPVVVTTTPGILGPTPGLFPVLSGNPNLTTSQILVTPTSGSPPAFIANPAADGTIYYIKGQKISTSNGSNCGASGFHGAAGGQPTPFIQDVSATPPAVIVGQTGNSVPQITQLVATSGACLPGTDPSISWSQGQPGCVMILPLVDSSSGLTFNIQAWAAFYVWCIRTTGGSGCQEFAGQFLANWPIAAGLSTNSWTFGSGSGGSGGGLTIVHLTG